MIVRLSLALIVLLGCEARAQDANFYAGKDIKMVVGSAPGGGYDTVARALARHIGRHIPGRPTITVQNMTGVSSIRMTNYLYNAAPKDGTSIGAAINGMPTAPLLQPEAAHFDAGKLQWIGSTNREIQVAYAWHTARVQNLADLMTKELVVGGAGPGTATVDFPLITSAILGFKFKLVRGYEGTAQIAIATERGEVEGNGGIGWATIKSDQARFLREKKINIVVQYGFEKHPELPDVPVAFDLAKSEGDRQALRLVFARQEYGRPFFVAPDVPEARVRILRDAFAATMKDPEFLAEAQRLNIELDPMSGERMAALIAQVSATPADIAARVRAVLEAK
jgi:tripartite-type tricarboxylate transporter receptor subunit TctC